MTQVSSGRRLNKLEIPKAENVTAVCLGLCLYPNPFSASNTSNDHNGSGFGGK